ncbi:MAG: urease accessory protein UreD [Pseudomonadota bacterium]
MNLNLMTIPPSERLQRARGTVRLGFEMRRGRSRLSDLYMDGSAKALLPRTASDVPEAVVINTSGGLTGGDRLDVNVTVGAGAQASVASQTAERAYRATGGVARVGTRLRLGPGARLDWLPQETILFDGSALERTIDADLAEGASLLIVEAVVLGRIAMGETLSTARFSDTWRLRRGGVLLHAEAARLGPETEAFRSVAGLGHAAALATVLYAGEDAADRLDAFRALAPVPTVRHAASAWGGRLVIRYLAPDAQPLRHALKMHLSFLRGRPMPRVWTM